MKTCSNPDCTEANPQPLENFKKKARYKDGIYPRCNTCEALYRHKYVDENRSKINARNQKLYHKNPSKHRQKARLCRFKEKYRPELSIKEVEIVWIKMYEEQQGKCSICKKPKLLEVEHCHRTGKVRSLACNGCNTALARIEENIQIAKNLILYIEKHNT